MRLDDTNLPGRCRIRQQYLEDVLRIQQGLFENTSDTGKSSSSNIRGKESFAKHQFDTIYDCAVP
jgi:hypothetical protein